MFVVEVTAALVTLVLISDFLGLSKAAAARSRPSSGLRVPDRDLALVHRLLRHVRRGAGRGPRQGPGGDPAQDPLGDDGPPPLRGRHDRGRRLLGAPLGRHRRRARGRDDPRRRRRDRGRGLRQRGGHHRRVGARSQGAGHGHPQQRHRRHNAHQRHAHDLHHRQPGRDLPRPDDRPGRRREAAAHARTRSPSRSCSPA